MTFLKHDPSTFAAAAAAGFADVHAQLVHSVDGGVVRATRASKDQVALVIGGGSGHYPAFAGLVGPGLAHGAVLGNIFASPSAHQVENVSRIADQGRGVLLSYGNYVGDVLQFEAAAERLIADGIPVKSVRVTDDISSAPPEEKDHRRGIAGDLVVFKVAGAAAARGDDLDRVFEVASQANDNTRSLGVAFTGCTLPGADEPLFTVPAGRMGVGLGIHGEPGLDETDVPTPAGLAKMLVSRLLSEVPGEDAPAGRRVVVIVNGLGAVKADELYVVYGEVKQQLEAAGVVIADAKVGEFCTSFEMAGLSLTLAWLDDELEELWLAPALSAEYSAGDPEVDAVAVNTFELAASETTPETVEVSEESRALAARLVDALATVAAVVDEHMEELGKIDAVAGDGDHGIGMHNGARSAAAAASSMAEQGAGAGTLLRRAGEAWSDGAGGTSGALWGMMLAALGDAFGDIDGFSPKALRQGVRAAADKVMSQGGAKVGDKTMVDALSPFADAIASAEQHDIAAVWRVAVEAAQQGAESTKGMLPALGRARSHGEQARDVADPGAISFALIVAAMQQHLC